MNTFLVIIFLGLSTSCLFCQRIEISKNIRKGGHIGFLLSPEGRTTEHPFLSSETFRAEADFIIDQSISVIETDDLFDGCVIYIGLRCLIDFYYKILPFINHKIIIVTSCFEPYCISKHFNWDPYYTSENYMTPLYAQHPNILAFFSKNMIYNHPKCFCLPLGKNLFYRNTGFLRQKTSKLTRAKFFMRKRIKVYCNFDVNTDPSRAPIFNHWYKFDDVTFRKNLTFPEYFTDMQNSKFVLSPRGFGIDCYRTWEALYAGSIPVVESLGIDQVYEGLPVIIVEDLTKVTLEDLDREYELMKTRKYDLDRLFADYWINKIRSCRKGA